MDEHEPEKTWPPQVNLTAPPSLATIDEEKKRNANFRWYVTLMLLLSINALVSDWSRYGRLTFTFHTVLFGIGLPAFAWCAFQAWKRYFRERRGR